MTGLTYAGRCTSSSECAAITRILVNPTNEKDGAAPHRRRSRACTTNRSVQIEYDYMSLTI